MAWLLGTGVVLLLFLSLTRLGRTLVRGFILFLAIMVPNRQWRALQWLVPPIRREQQFVGTGARRIRLDIYSTPSKVRRPAVIVYCPLAPEGPENRYVMNVMKALARSGYVAVLPSWPDRPLGLIDPVDVEDFGMALKTLTQLPAVDPKRIGIVGISYGIGPALLALTRTKLANPVQFVVSISGYASLMRLFEFALTGRASYKDESISLKPHPYIIYVLLRTLAQHELTTQDRETVSKLLDATPTSQPIDLIALRSRLRSATGQKFLSILTDNKEITGAALQKRFPVSAQRMLDDLSIHSAQDMRIATKAFILHSASDDLVPYTESLRLNDILAKRWPTQLTIIRGFDHVLPPGLTLDTLLRVYAPNAWAIFAFIYQFVDLYEEHEAKTA